MALKNKQKLLAELMAVEPELTNMQYAEKIGIDVKTLYAWKRNDEFNEYLHECCKQQFKSFEKVAIKKLHDNILKGNQKSIEYLLNYIGYQGVQKVEADLNASIEIDYGDDD